MVKVQWKDTDNINLIKFKLLSLNIKTLADNHLLEKFAFNSSLKIVNKLLRSDFGKLFFYILIAGT